MSKPKRIMSERYQGRWVAHATEVWSMLGVKRLPEEGMPERLIQGIRVYVKPAVPHDGRRYRFGGRLIKRHKHRVMAICECGRHIPVGRLHQHKHKEE